MIPRREVPSLWVAMAICVSLLVCPQFSRPAASQDHCGPAADTSDSELAARFAPVLRFAPSEPYFPTIPFFYAFDGVDNNGNGLTDFEDLDEIAAYDEGDSLRSSWTVLDSRYTQELKRLSDDSRVSSPVPPVPAVFYHVRNLTEDEEDAMWRYLKKDILAWDRADESEWRGLNLENEPFKVIEYYYYYVRDRGLVGHPQDIEFVFVFVPADPALACKFRVVVGAGHTNRVPNNVLVLTNEEVLGMSNLAQTDTLTSVIVELGGHSSAPDLPPYGQFMLGVDVNWQTPKSWGTRDVQSLALMGYAGEYRSEMTLPRTPNYHPLVLWPRGTSAGEESEYALVPAPLFERLSGELANASAGLSPDQWPATVDSVGAILDSIRVLLDIDNLSGLGSLDSTHVRRMTIWNESMIASESIPEGGVISPGRMQVWKHWQYTHQATYIFKPHLFPPSVKSIEKPRDILRLISWGYTAWPGAGHRWAAGFVIPWIETPIEVRGFLELQAGVSTTGEFDATEFSMKLAYFNSYFQRVSWYTSVAWMPNPTVTGAHFTVVAGPSFLLWTRPSKSLLGPVNVLRLSTGPRFKIGGSASTGVDWEFAFSFRQ